IGESDPAMPDGVINRMADNWRPLLAIAAAAKGEWPQRARKAAEASRGAEGDEASRLELRPADSRPTAKGTGPTACADLAEEQGASEGRPWAEMGKAGKPLTQNKLARMLKPLGIAPENIYVGDEKRPKGYVFKHFEEAFTRYLPPEGASEPLNRYNADETGTSDLFQTAQPNPDVADGKCEKPANDGHCSVLADAKGDTGEKTHVRTTRAKSDDLPYTGPVVDVPDQGPDGLDEHGAPQAPQDQGPPGASASVPFMMTQETKRRLRICGYSDAQIAGMTPQAAHNILGQWAPQPTNGGEPGLSSRRIQ